MRYHRPKTVTSSKRHDYGSATAKQREYLGFLARAIAPGVDEYATIRGFGGPDDMRSITLFQASLIIDNMRAVASGKARDEYVDPGELAQDRWNETHR